MIEKRRKKCSGWGSCGCGEERIWSAPLLCEQRGPGGNPSLSWITFWILGILDSGNSGNSGNSGFWEFWEFWILGILRISLSWITIWILPFPGSRCHKCAWADLWGHWSLWPGSTGNAIFVKTKVVVKDVKNAIFFLRKYIQATIIDLADLRSPDGLESTVC